MDTFSPYGSASPGFHQQNPDGSWEWSVNDGLNSVRSMVDASLTPFESRQYSPFGEPFGMTGTPQTPFGFTGEPTDGNNLVYLRSRYYNPYLGIFPDLDMYEGMICNPMALNRYSYVEDNPTNVVDPSGMCGQPTNWSDPFDVNCYYSADGLAKRFSNGDSNAYQAWFNVLIKKNWGELKAIEIGGTAVNVTGGSRQLLNDAAIIPRIIRQNPRAALQALQQYGCEGKGGLLGSAALLIAASIQSVPTTTVAAGEAIGSGGLTAGGVGLAALAGIALAVGGLTLWDELTGEQEKVEPIPPEMKRRWHCETSCQVSGPNANKWCFGITVQGTGEGSSRSEACDAAKSVANAMVPRGCYKRHCDCDANPSSCWTI